MGVAPNSTIQVFKGVPLKNRYEDTFYFESRDAQNTYFSKLTPINIFSNQYRVEPNQLSITVELTYDKLYKCNYMRFNNNSYENRWFYAFITNVEYVNEAATRIYFQLDVMQTWLPQIDYTLGACFVEREHSKTDGIGDNIISENLATGEYIINRSANMFFTRNTDDNMQFVIVLIANEELVTDDIVLYDNILSCCTAFIFCTTIAEDMQALQSLITHLYTDMKGDRLLSMYMLPPELLDTTHVDWVNHRIESFSTGKTRELNGFHVDTSTTLDGYKPRNNKCYTYPYTFETAISSDGSSMNKRYEFCKRNENGEYASEYVMTSNIMQPLQVVLRNKNYRNKNDNTGEFVATFDEKLVISNFPICAWTYDTYKIWLENELPKQLIGMGNTAVMTGVAVASHNPVWAVMNGANLATQIGGLLWENNIRSKNNIQTSGNFSSSGADYGNRMCGFTFYQYSVSAEYAKTIDDYFTMFGYATKRVKVPNIHARENWTYTKTVNCSLMNEELPVVDSNKIESIFNAGIRFWNPSATIYDYTQSNGIV